jgi:hypothetical protein
MSSCPGFLPPPTVPSPCPVHPASSVPGNMGSLTSPTSSPPPVTLALPTVTSLLPTLWLTFPHYLSLWNCDCHCNDLLFHIITPHIFFTLSYQSPSIPWAQVASPPTTPGGLGPRHSNPEQFSFMHRAMLGTKAHETQALSPRPLPDSHHCQAEWLTSRPTSQVTRRRQGQLCTGPRPLEQPRGVAQMAQGASLPVGGHTHLFKKSPVPAAHRTRGLRRAGPHLISALPWHSKCPVQLPISQDRAPAEAHTL